MARPNYGPNYKTPAAEAKALRGQRATSWFDSCAAILLLMCLLAPVFYLVTHAGMHDTCRTTQAICSVSPEVQP